MIKNFNFHIDDKKTKVHELVEIPEYIFAFINSVIKSWWNIGKMLQNLKDAVSICVQHDVSKIKVYNINYLKK